MQNKNLLSSLIPYSTISFAFLLLTVGKKDYPHGDSGAGVYYL